MSENYSGENQPTDGAGAKFRGVRTDTGVASEFLSPAGDGPVTEHGKRVAAQRVNQPSDLGMGLAVGTQEDTAATTDTGTFSLIALVKRLLSKLTDSLGASTAAAVEGDADGSANAHLRGLAKTLGATDDDFAVDDVGTYSYIALFRRLLIKGNVWGSSTGSAVTTDADGSHQQYLRGLVKWAAERMPASLGRKSAANSLPIVLSDEDLAAVGATGETAPASDTATSGLNGRLQRIAQRLTSLIGLLPAALGPATSTASLPVTQVANTATLATAVTVGTSAGALPASALANRRTLTGRNNGTSTIYLGPSGVTTTNGLPVDPGQFFSATLGPGVSLYAISAVAGQNVRVLEAS
jgi:hypothetical protein